MSKVFSGAHRSPEKPVSPGDVVWSYSGIRFLLDDRVRNGSEGARDELRADLYRALWIQGGTIAVILTAPRFLPI